ncbi:hypothetical protein [Hymenobacter sp. DG01]|uniref:hypothetical protein n=1 Tax=Hymenobacter sp. DG01 TaxID=2584940 RepID=UPI00111D6A07|nr:hypothetical protein [Hymenobacter sp. DG01]
MAKVFQDYIVVRDNDAGDFGRKVMAAQKQGYRCRGKMQTQRSGDYVFDYLQNMVKDIPASAEAPKAS